jgi:hypothetical protein
MSSDNRQKTLAALNDLWQGNPIRRTRQGEGAYTLYGRRLAVHLMVQPGVAQTFMADPMAGDTGFLPRFLICAPASTIGRGSRTLAKPNDAALGAFAARLRAILETPLPVDPDTRELSPRLLPLSGTARQLLARFADAIEVEQAPSRSLAHVTGHASKAAEQAARMAGVLTLWRELDAPEVPGEAMADAITLAQFYLGEAARLADAATVSVVVEQAEALRNWLLGGWTEPEVLPRDVVQLGPNALRETAKARAALVMLEAHGWLVKLEEGAIVRGSSRREAWRIVRPCDVV